jgi:putative transposase
MPDGQPIRKKMKRREEPGGLRSLTFSCERRLPLMGHPRIRDVFVGSLDMARREFGLAVIAWVVMPEHVHLLARPREGTTMAEALKSLKLSVSEQVIARWRELDASVLKEIEQEDGTPRFWQAGGGFDRNVRDSAEMSRTIRYIHRNPLKRGLVQKPEDWAWSSLRWWMGEREGQLACEYPRGGGWDRWRGFV